MLEFFGNSRSINRWLDELGELFEYREEFTPADIKHLFAEFATESARMRAVTCCTTRTAGTPWSMFSRVVLPMTLV